MKNPSKIIILGGRSLVAPYLMQRLAAKGLGAQVVSRKPLFLLDGFEALQIDIGQPEGWQVPDGAVVILSLLPLWVLADRLNLMEKASSIIAVSSTSRFGKAGSSDPKERETAQKLADGEDKIEAWAKRTGVPFTILRPTLIYDGRNDQNVTRIARAIRRFGLFPVAAPAKGLRQPIHADDVAGAMMGAMNNPRAANKSFNIAGAQILTYREVVETVFRTLGRYPLPVLLPVWLLEIAFRAAQATGLLHERDFGFAVFQRMNEDLVFDVQEGLEVLQYAPRAFKPGP